MKQIIFVLFVVILVVFGYGSIGAGQQAQPTVEISGPIKMDKAASATITGKGFKPGQELNILFIADDGAQSDISFSLKSSPKADGSGAWSTTWAAGEFVAQKLVKAGGSYKLTVTDSDYNPIAHTSVAFVK